MVKLLIYSDLHLEFGTNFKPPKDIDADIMILAGDIITFKNFEPLTRFLEGWNKPVLFVAGNHEFYTKEPIWKGLSDFKSYVEENHKNLIFLEDSSYSFGDVEFFGGTMWTDFKQKNPLSMMLAEKQINDFYLIKDLSGDSLRARDTVIYHEHYKKELIKFLKKNKDKKRVIISHHAPVDNPNDKHKGSGLSPAFVATDMFEIIEKYQPEIFVYGHTHQCDDQMIGKTRIVSNQRGYPHEICEGFNKNLILEM